MGGLMKVEICLLDLDYEKVDGNVPIILHGRSTDGKRVVVIDPTYEPYFYILPKDVDRAREDIEDVLKKKNVEVKRIEVTKRFLFGEEKEFIKVYCLLPQD